MQWVGEASQRSHRATWLLGLTSVLLACSCAPAADKPPPRGPQVLHPPASGYAAIWVNQDLEPIDQLTAIGSVMLGIATDQRQTFVIALDPATGRMLWRQTMMVPPSITPGVTAELAAIGDDKVAYYRPYGGSYTTLVIADARTGGDLASSPPMLFKSWPHACNDGKDACTLSHGDAGGREHVYRLEVASGDFAPESDSLRPGARLLGDPYPIDLGDRPGDTIAWLHDGELRWRLALRDAFPPGFSSDNGWTWRTFDDAHVVVGSVFGEEHVVGETRSTDLARSSATAGIAIDTGKVLWRDVGTTFGCWLTWIRAPIRCRQRGTWTLTPERTSLFAGLDVTVEGFDPVTGRTTWSVPVGPAEALVDPRKPFAIAGPAQIIVRGASRPVLLDTATGTATPPPPGATYWCMTRIRYYGGPSFTSVDGTVHYDRPGGRIASVCDAAGTPSADIPGTASTIAAGARVGNHAVIAARHGYVGFRLH